MDNHKQLKHIPPAAFHFMTNYYDAITEIFGFGKKFKRRILDILSVKDGETILDIGSGTGTLLLLSSKTLPHSKLVGVDPDHRAMSIARKKLIDIGQRIVFYETSAEQLPIPNNSIDICVSTLVFHHLPQVTKLKAIQEAYRVLKPGGKFLLADFGKPASSISSILLFIGSFVDGRDGMRANLAGILPLYLKQVGFYVSEIEKPYRGVQFLMAKK